MAGKRLSAVAARIRDKALSYPQTGETFPWGEHAFKVKGKALHAFIDESFRAVARVLRQLDA